MTVLKRPSFISIEDYLNGEERSEIRHEFLDGEIHAMAGETLRHSAISGNVVAYLWGKLRGGPYCTLGIGARLRIELPRQTRFYYPDGQVVCKPVPGKQLYLEHPTVVAEVFSELTRRIDWGEKRETYLAISSLQVLMLVDSEQKQVTLYRRSPSGEFTIEGYTGSDSIALPEIGTELSLEEIYEGVELA